MLYVCVILDNDNIGIMDTEKRKLFFYTVDEIKFLLQFNIEIKGVTIGRENRLIIDLPNLPYTVLETDNEMETFHYATYTIAVGETIFEVDVENECMAVEVVVKNENNCYIRKMEDGTAVFDWYTSYFTTSNYKFDEELCLEIAKAIYAFETKTK